MRFSGRHALVAVGFALLAGCSTINSRIENNPGAFQSLSPTDQALVRAGQIREGMPRSAVYLAWGQPDQLRRGVRNGHPYEAWVYTRLQEVFTPNYYPRFYRFGWYRYGGYWGGYPFYGPYDDAFYSDWISIPVPYKTAFFEGPRCTGYEYIQ